MIKKIRDIIANGKTNSARKQNKLLAEAGTPPTRGRPKRVRGATAAPALLSKRELPKPLPDEYDTDAEPANKYRQASRSVCMSSDSGNHG